MLTSFISAPLVFCANSYWWFEIRQNIGSVYHLRNRAWRQTPNRSNQNPHAVRLYIATFLSGWNEGFNTLHGITRTFYNFTGFIFSKKIIKQINRRRLRLLKFEIIKGVFCDGGALSVNSKNLISIIYLK
jgi:hypothetical protein